MWSVTLQLRLPQMELLQYVPVPKRASVTTRSGLEHLCSLGDNIQEEKPSSRLSRRPCAIIVPPYLLHSSMSDTTQQEGPNHSPPKLPQGYVAQWDGSSKSWFLSAPHSPPSSGNVRHNPVPFTDFVASSRVLLR